MYVNQSLFEINLFEIRLKRAEVAELVDALGSGSSWGSPVGVRVSPSAPLKKLKQYTYSIRFSKSISFRLIFLRAEVAELVDALGSGSSWGFPVGVRVSPSAPPE